MLKYTVTIISVLMVTATVNGIEPFQSKNKVILDAFRLDEKDANVQSTGCLADENISRLTVEFPVKDEADAFDIRKGLEGANILDIFPSALMPNKSTVRILLPGDGKKNGNIWHKNGFDYLSFMCRSSQPVKMSVHLLKRGKSAGMYSADFTAGSTDWQHILIPVKSFSRISSFKDVAGIGFRVQQDDIDEDVTVSIADLNVCKIPYSEKSWEDEIYRISLKGDWYFKPAATMDDGIKGGWYKDDYDSDDWKVLKSGKSWQDQGIEHYGFGWYRQSFFVPQELEGIPVKINLTKIPSDDDVWVNGQRIGGFSSEYKYENWMLRSYTVPESVIKYGATNSIALRIWGGRITFIGNDSGLVDGPLNIEINPYTTRVSDADVADIPIALYDFSDTVYGKTFDLCISVPKAFYAVKGIQADYEILDYLGNEITSGPADLAQSTDRSCMRIHIDKESAQRIYFAGLFSINVIIKDQNGNPLCSVSEDVHQMLFLKRDEKSLDPLPNIIEDTPYGKLKLIDEIKCSTSLYEDPHPYMQGGLWSHKQKKRTPGSPVDVWVKDILGKKARGCEYGWFAYRVGRGKLKPHSTYLLRIEYPEDIPRYVPIEIQTGQNYMDVGWKNGVGEDDPYDNWPLSGKWQMFDVIVPLDDETVGTGGTGSASAENGFWVYFMNKLKPNCYYAMWDGGPAIASIKLYEIDENQNSPEITYPEGMPKRILNFDWERQADHDPVDLIKYAKLMGYNAMSPIMLKWFHANYSDPLNGYPTITIDDRNYWAHKSYIPGEDAQSPIPQNKSQHVRYLEATKKYGINYIPRIEWGGSIDLPESAQAVDAEGKPAKPNRYAKKTVNIMDPLAWNDMERLMNHLIKPYADDNPQLNGVLWRTRCNTQPISYSDEDIKMFEKETGIKLASDSTKRYDVAKGRYKEQYEDWWHKKRRDFHARLVKLLKSYRPDMTLYYFNWDADKFGIIEPDLTAWAFVKNVVRKPPVGGKNAYLSDRAVRKQLTADDYIYALRTGDFLKPLGVHRADMGIRPELYKDVNGIQIFAPVNYLCYADKPEYLNYFKVKDGIAVSHTITYDEIASRFINPKYECNEVVPAGPDFSMALEVLAYYYSDPVTLTYTSYTYGRGFADAHRKFAQAYLALPAKPGKIIEQGTIPVSDDVRVRTYEGDEHRFYISVVHKGYGDDSYTVNIPVTDQKATVTDLVSGKTVKSRVENGKLTFNVKLSGMELRSFRVDN